MIADKSLGEYTSSLPVRLRIRKHEEQLYASFDEHPFVRLRAEKPASLEYQHDISGIRLQFVPDGSVPMILLKGADEEIAFWKAIH